MTTYTVCICEQIVSYRETEITIDAENCDDAASRAYEIALNDDTKWRRNDTEETGTVDFQVSSENEPTITWRED